MPDEHSREADSPLEAEGSAAAEAAPPEESSEGSLVREDEAPLLPAWRNLLVIIPFAILLALPLPLDAVLQAADTKLPERAFFRKTKDETKLRDFLDGTAGSNYERRAINESYFARYLTPRYNELVFYTFARSTPASWIGKSDFLFIPGRVREHSERLQSEMTALNVEVISRVNEEVETHGAELVVALVPDRARVFADKAYRQGKVPPRKAQFLSQLKERLENKGVIVLDLTQDLIQQRDQGADPYYSDDHHWTSHGADAAAKAILKKLPPEQRKVLQRPRNAKPRYTVRWRHNQRSESSLVRKLGFRKEGGLERTFRTREPRATFSGRPARGFQASCGTYWSTSYGLFGSPELFNNHAGCPVRIIMKAGVGSGWAAREDLKRLRRTRRLSKPHLIIWELPEYHLYEQPEEFRELLEFLRSRK